MGEFVYVTIKMKKTMSDDEIRKFIEENLDVDIIKIENNEVTLDWPLNEQEGIHGIEETLYYLLEDTKLGDYSYYKKK